MKRKLLIIGGILTFALAMPMIGQSTQGNIASTDVITKDTAEVVTTPTFEATTAGVHMKVWILMSKGEPKDNDMSSAKATKAETTADSYQAMVELKTAEGGKTVADATTSLMTVSPTSKNATFELKPMRGQFGGNITLDEKGEYQFTLNINTGGTTNATTFKFTVQ